MGMFDRKKKIKLGGRSSSNSDFDFDFDDSSMDFDDNHNVSTSRKATLKNYAVDHYKGKMTDKNEQKRLLKAALPSSYSSSVDLASDLKDDYDQVKYEVGKEWEKVKSPLKKALKGNAKYLRMAKLGRLANWSESDSGGRYQEEEVNTDEALVQSMLSDFTNPKNQKERAAKMQSEQKIRQTEREESSEFRTQSLSAQLQATASSAAALSELRRLTTYQDQVTFLYQKKNLEVNIRNLIESRKQTDILKTYKDESISELKEIHKNTALPDAVKINQSELAAQVFKQNMLGKAAGWFDGKLSPLRKRITSRIRDKLTEMTRDFGASLTSWNEMMESASENGDSTGSFFGKMLADSALDKGWHKATKRPLNWIRNKLQGNSRVNRYGRGLNAMHGNLGGMINSGLLSGSTGNKFLDKFVDFMGLKQAAITRDDHMRGSLSKHLDSAQYMSLRFTQTVERVIPHWLSKIHKENYLIRMGMGFKDGDGKNGTIAHKEQTWDWDRDGLVDVDDKRTEIKSQLFSKERMENYSFSLERLLRHLGSGYLKSNSAYDKLKKWVMKQISDGKMADHYALLTSLNQFSKSEQDDIKIMVAATSGLLYDQIEEDIDSGQWKNFLMLFDKHNVKYANWLNTYAKLAGDFAGRSVMDWSKIQELVDQGHHHMLEELGVLNRGSDGSFSRNINFEHDAAMQLGKVGGNKVGVQRAKAGEDRTWVDSHGRSQKAAGWDADDGDHDDFMNGNNLSLVRGILSFFASYDTHEKLTERQKKSYEDKQKAAFGNLLNRKASGGWLGRFSKDGYTGDGPIDGPINATLDGKEYVSDSVTTEKNKALLMAMNKLKAPVVLPDGTVNPVYYKAFGFKDEESFKDAHNNADVMSIIASTKGRHGKAARKGLGQALKWMNGDKSGTKDKRDKIIAESKKFFKGFSEELKNYSEEQLESLFWEIEGHGDHSLISDKDWEFFGDDSNSWADRVKRISSIYFHRGNRGGYVKSVFTKWSKKAADSSKQGLKNFINGEGSTENTDELKKLANGIKTKGKDLWSNRQEHVNMALEKLRVKKARDIALKAWKDQAVDVYIVGSTSSPRLTVAGFADGSYINKEDGRICSSHHDITGVVTAANGDVLITPADFAMGFCDKEGNVLHLSDLKRYRNIAKEEASKAYNKYAKKHVDKGVGMILGLTEKWQHMFKTHAIDIYVGAETNPRLTAAGFSAGSYFSATTKKPVMGYLDIAGPVMDATGKYLISKNDLESSVLLDKDGNPVKPPKLMSNMERLKGIVYKALKLDKLKALGKKGWQKAKDFSMSRAAKHFSTAGQKAVDVYINGVAVLLAVDFKAGKLIDLNSGKPLANHYQITGPVVKLKEDGTSETVLTQEQLEQGGFTDVLGKPLPAVQTDFLRGALYRGMGRLGLNSLKGLKGKLLDHWNSAKKPDTPTVTQDLIPEKVKPGVYHKNQADAPSSKRSMFSGIRSRLSKFGNKISGGIKGKLSDWKDAALSKLTGKDPETKELRKGSWQEKLANKAKDSWIGKLASAMGGGKKGEKHEEKKSWLGKLIAGVMMVGTTIVNGITVPIKWLGKKLINGFTHIAKNWIAKPLMRSIAWLGTKLGKGALGAGKFLGRNAGKLLKGGRLLGAAGMAYGAYSALNEEKTDADGNPILGKDGKPTTEAHYGKAALYGLGAAAMVPGGLGAMAGIASGAAALLAPIALPLAAVAAVGYGAYKLYQFGKKRDAERDYPITAFRVNQYGFSITDQPMVDKMIQLETVLKPFVNLQGENVNFKSDIDVEAVFSVFGLQYQGGDATKNQKFLAWFLGRFKPVYVSYVKAMNTIKKTTDLNGIEKKLTPPEAMALLEKVHFKNQSERNPYNVMISPVDDPDKCDYDFEDIEKRYQAVKEILQDKAKMMSDSGQVGTLDDEKKTEDAEKETVMGGFKEGFKKGGIVGGIVGGSINILKKLGSGVGDMFNMVTGGVKKLWTGMTDMLNKKWENLKAMFKNIADIVADPVKAAKDWAKKKLGKDNVEKLRNARDSVSDSASSLGSKVSNWYGSAKQLVVGSGKGGWHQNKPKELESWIQKYSKQYELNPQDMLGFAMVESNGNPNAGNGSFKGLMQMGPDATKQVGMSWDEVSTNPEKNVEAGIKYAAYNRGIFKKATGREPEGYELYMMHQQGAGGVSQLVKAANGGTLSPEMRAKMDANGGKGKSAAQFLDYWRQRFANSSAAANGTAPASTSMAGAKPTASPATATAAASAKKPGDTSMPAPASSASVTPGTGASSGAAPAASGGNNSSPASTAIATPKAGGGTATGMALTDPKLIAIGKTHYKLKDNKVVLAGMNELFMDLFWTMLGEAKNKGCMVVQINEGVRDYAEQCRLYKAYCDGQGALAAKPGTSRHGKGEAMDCNTANLDELDGKGLLAKYGFSRPLMKKLKSGKMTETWHIENKYVPNTAGSAPVLPPINDPSDPKQADPSVVSAAQNAGVNTGNQPINKVVNQGGGNNTSSVSTAQQGDGMSGSAVSDILTKQLSVQTDMRSTLIDIRDILKGTDPKSQQNLNQLKRPQTGADVGTDIGNNIADILATKFGLGKAADPQKPIPVISASK